MKRTVRSLLLVFLMLLLSVTAFAQDSSRSYSFDLSANGGYEIQAKPGDIIAVTLRLLRTDAEQSAPMYAMQDEITYDGSFFELVDSGAIAATGIATQDIGLRDGSRAYYMNYVSLSGGDEWEPDTMVGMFQLKVTGESGSSVIENRNFLVSTADGSDTYLADATSITVVVSDTCTVRFETGEGSDVESQTVSLGGKVIRPVDPTREGYALRGWFRDYDRTEPWDFETDTVSGNMTLYAGWMEAPAMTLTVTPTGNAPEESQSSGGFSPILIGAICAAVLVALIVILVLTRRVSVRFSVIGAKKIPDAKVRKGHTVPEPPVPVRAGYVFAGWYTDRGRTEQWDFETGRVHGKMTLYARWLTAEEADELRRSGKHI